MKTVGLNKSQMMKLVSVSFSLLWFYITVVNERINVNKAIFVDECKIKEGNLTLLRRPLHRRVISIFLAHCFDFTACKVNVLYSLIAAAGGCFQLKRCKKPSVRHLLGFKREMHPLIGEQTDVIETKT